MQTILTIQLKSTTRPKVSRALTRVSNARAVGLLRGDRSRMPGKRLGATGPAERTFIGFRLPSAHFSFAFRASQGHEELHYRELAKTTDGHSG